MQELLPVLSALVDNPPWEVLCFCAGWILHDILSPSLQDVYVVKGEREIMIPVVPEFILETNVEEGYIKVHLIEGM